MSEKRVIKSSNKTVLKFKRHQKVDLKIPQFHVDYELHPRLNDIALMKNMNTHFATAMIGAAGSGKTSLMLAMLSTKSLYKRIFDKIYLFIPPNSLASIKNNELSTLPEDQIYSELNIDNLIDCFEKVEKNSKDDKNSLVIFDDVQQFLKGGCESLIVHMINNRRHNRLSVIILAQSYKKVPKMARQAFTDLFLFRLSKEDYAQIFGEVVHISKLQWESLLNSFSTVQKDLPNSFLYISIKNQEYFINWDECILGENAKIKDEDDTGTIEK